MQVRADRETVVIHQSHADAVFATVAALLDDLAPAAEYRLLFDQATAAVRRAAEGASIFPPVDLPMAVGEAMGLEPEQAQVAATACTLLWSGADLMDDAADGQLGEEWKDVSPARIALVATNLLATLPHLLVGRRDAGGGAISSAWSLAVSRTLFTMSEGQWSDLGGAGVVATTEQYMAMVRRKTGAEFALFASAPALLAGADAETIGAWVRFGMAYGTMSQVFSDTLSTLVEGPRNDLLSGKRSLPVLETLAILCDSEHARFLAELDSAESGDESAVARAIETMTTSGALKKALEIGELLRHRAMQALPAGRAGAGLSEALRILLTSHRLM
jgi:geranylgeranyl pyrophosphate synthase